MWVSRLTYQVTTSRGRSNNYCNFKAVMSMKVEVKVKMLVAQPCLTLCNPMVYNLCPCKSPGKDTGVGSHSLLQGIFPTQGSNLSLPHCRQILYHLSNQGSICNNGNVLWKYLKSADMPVTLLSTFTIKGSAKFQNLVRGKKLLFRFTEIGRTRYWPSKPSHRILNNHY